jgi:hypothetical protein
MILPNFFQKEYLWEQKSSFGDLRWGSGVMGVGGWVMGKWGDGVMGVGGWGLGVGG